MVKTNYSGSADLFTKTLVVSLRTPFPEPHSAHMA